MKIAFFSESVADESALKILVSGILEEEIEREQVFLIAEILKSFGAIKKKK